MVVVMMGLCGDSSMSAILGVSDIARITGVKPAVITRLFYDRKLRDDLCPVVSGRRQIPASYVRFIVFELQRKGISVKGGWEDAVEALGTGAEGGVA